MNTEQPVSPRIAVLIPCFNEASAIDAVVSSFRAALPTAEIYVFDNNSVDDTAAIARDAGAIVRRERRQGKGHVVRRMFADVEADVYVLADGDGTYDACAAAPMVDELVGNQLDMVVGVRRSDTAEATYRRGHQFGNRLFSYIVSVLFEDQFSDILSGYRVMSRRFVKSFPALAKGFEIETQLTVHALELSVPCAEYATAYYARAEGTQSKLRTYRDGTRILLAILLLFKETRPFAFFGLLGLLCAGLSGGFGLSVIIEYFETGLVPRFPTAILATGLGLMAAICFTAGFTLDTVSRGQRELKRLHYLQLSTSHGDRP
ncbi:MAG: glycosyltransferase [Gammaproteobacteria bacterium]|nr:glycosyltransferase [Gammaproteobacteria bacterium]